ARPHFLSTLPRPPTPTLFPYTTLFRSLRRAQAAGHARRLEQRQHVRAQAGQDRLRLGIAEADVELEYLRAPAGQHQPRVQHAMEDRKSTRLNSSHVKISYAVFCLKKKK